MIGAFCVTCTATDYRCFLFFFHPSRTQKINLADNFNHFSRDSNDIRNFWKNNLRVEKKTFEILDFAVSKIQ